MGQVSISGVTYDIYGTHTGAPVAGVLSAQQYFAAATHASAYTTADGTNQKKALVTATRMLDRAPWQGQKTSPAQALQWPRTGVVDKYGNEVDSAAVPADIIYGCYELALAILEDEVTQTQKNTGTNVRRQKNIDKVADLMQEVETEYFRPTDLLAGRFPTIVQELVGQYMSGAGSSIAGAFASGTDVESQFDDEDEDFSYNPPGVP